MINKTLDLPFDEPQETYSTSEHLWHDQGIPPGTKGRIVDPAPVEKKERAPRERRSGSGSGSGRSGSDAASSEKSGDSPRRRNRNRRRTRGGESVEAPKA